MGSSEKILIWGASGHALVVADILQAAGWQIAGFIDDVNPSKKGTSFSGAMVLGGREQLDVALKAGVRKILIAVGDCAARLRLAEEALRQGFELGTAVHPNAVVARSVVVGPGSVVAAGAVVNPAAVIGANVIINTGAGVDHECRIGDGAHIGPGARLGGRVTIGKGAWVGIGASVKDGVTIGDGAILGAGAVALEAVPAGMVAYGVPAKVARPVGQP